MTLDDDHGINMPWIVTLNGDQNNIYVSCTLGDDYGNALCHRSSTCVNYAIDLSS